VSAPPDAIAILSAGEVEVEGRMPWSSNGTFLASVCLAGTALSAVYKPGRGERPLWDFPGGLFRREVAAYELSRFLGWDLVPETILRADAPLGKGSLQRFVDADFSEHYFTLMERPEHHDQLRDMAVLDLLLNNADRKSGHCLVDADGRIWGIDNGLSFHVEPKLRTVIWDFAGHPVPDRLLEGIGRVAEAVPDSVAGLLEDDETAALTRRARSILARPVLPAPHPERRPYPWPMV